ncbi:fasciclin-like arabinogalactan family protein [Tasmannia lanceolata]|uniref:fasciclin-like arabinogalactan family protein n=1 Tax=Tasmannia lanceolata TaxID=3420 RepID=UPI0040639650
MAIYLTLVLLMGLLISASPINGTPIDDELVAIEEMQTANYFTFVMLIRTQQDRIPANITFLMPNDRMLSMVSLPENAVSEFLARHSIPSPLLFDHLKHLPTGSVIPTCEPEFMLRITNNGRRRFYLNNVQIISPNICSSGSSIRCHGISGVLLATAPESNKTVPSSNCFPASPQIASAPTLPQPSPSPQPPAPLSPEAPANLGPIATPTPVDSNTDSQNSASQNVLQGAELFGTITSWLILSLVFQV